jgi:hypothetical protein
MMKLGGSKAQEIGSVVIRDALSSSNPSFFPNYASAGRQGGRRRRFRFGAAGAPLDCSAPCSIVFL